MEREVKQNTESVQGITGDPETEIRKVVNRHIQNQDDIISEEEFRNLKVGIPLTSEEEETDQKPLPQDENIKNQSEEKNLTGNKDLQNEETPL